MVQVATTGVMGAGCEKRTRFLRVLVATVIHAGRTPISFQVELRVSM